MAQKIWGKKIRSFEREWDKKKAEGGEPHKGAIYWESKYKFMLICLNITFLKDKHVCLLYPFFSLPKEAFLVLILKLHNFLSQILLWSKAVLSLNHVSTHFTCVWVKGFPVLREKTIYSSSTPSQGIWVQFS